MQKETLRILLTLQCNLKCPYFCNNLPQVKAKIRTVDFLSDHDVEKYENICLTGGEPLQHPISLWGHLDWLAKKKVYLYTNGLLFDDQWMRILRTYDNLKAVNFGIHSPEHPQKLDRGAIAELASAGKAIRFNIQDTLLDQTLKLNPWILHNKGYEIKAWKLNDCARENEDIVLISKEVRPYVSNKS